MTFEQIERSVLGMVSRLIEQFEHGEIGIVGMMERLSMIEQWESDRLDGSEDNFTTIVVGGNHG